MNYLILTLIIINLSANNINNVNVEKELECLTKNIYFEARGETNAGQVAVAHVTLERVHSKKHPNTICEVVEEPGQFSWFWDNKSNEMKNKKAKKKAYLVAISTLLGRHKSRIKGAQFYHNTSITPYWTKNMIKVAQIDNHVFYKEKIN